MLHMHFYRGGSTGDRVDGWSEVYVQEGETKEAAARLVNEALGGQNRRRW